MKKTWIGSSCVALLVLALGGTSGCKGKDEGSSGDGDGDADSPPELPRPVSGTRLKQTWWQAGDAVVPQQILDTELDVGCQFLSAEDDTLRCLPSGGSVVFADDDCTEALALSYPDSGCGSGNEPTFAGTYTRPSSCDETQYYLLWQVDEPVETPTNIYILEAEGCVESTVDEAATYYATSDVDLSIFVRGEYVLDERTDEVGVRFIHADDGAWFPHSLVNLSNGKDCSVTDQGEGADMTYHCVTGSALSSSSGFGGFADDACTERAALHFNECAPPEVVLSNEGDPLCPVRVLREVGEELSTFYMEESEVCSEGDTDFRPTDRHYEVGDLATGLIELEVTAPADGSRVQNRYYTLDGVPLALLPSPYDTELEAECNALSFSGGKLACAPQLTLNVSSGSAEVFADDACTQALVPGSSPRCKETDFAYISIQGGDACDAGTLELYAAGEEFSSDTVYVKNGETCEPSATSIDTVWYEKNEELDLEDTFALFTDAVDD